MTMNAWVRKVVRGAVCVGVAVVYFVFPSIGVEAAEITAFSDRISNSAPGDYANHTVTFTTAVSIPAGGYVRITPQAGFFTVPAINFDHKNVELLVSTSSGFIPRSATTTADATNDGVTITTGTSGSVEIELNTTVAIPAGAGVRVRIGNQTTNATTSDTGLQNPGSTGSYKVFVETGTATTSISSVNTWVAIIENIGVGPVDTTETVPPVRFNGAPTGTISGTTQNVEVSLETDELAICRYSSASGTPYANMGNEISSSFKLVHTFNVAVATNTQYTFYVRCVDDEGNRNTDDYAISFFVPEFPEGEPGDDGDEEGEGSGTGEGSGSSDPGSGEPSGSDNASGGSSGGGGGGGSGGGSGSSSGGSGGSGGFEGSGAPYQSGDGRVIINGYAFPQSRVVALVDGAVSEEATADSSGDFLITIDAIARGTYTFGVYAIDRNGVRSSTFSTTFLVIGAKTSSLNNVNIMPSIKVDPDPVDPGQTLSVSGYSIPNAVVTVENQSDRTSASLKSFTVNSNSSGAWSLTIDTTGFLTGTYKIRAKAVQESGDLVSTNFSGYTYYGVGEKAAGPRTADLNRDGKVNLVDFSILLFHWGTSGGQSDPPADINADGTVSLTDFSIMLFQWTG